MNDQKKAKRILVIDDDTDMIEVLTVNLIRAGYQVQSAHNGASGLGMALTGDYDLAVLDLKMPDIDGFQVCKTLRQSQCHTPVIMLTSVKTEPQKVAGLEIGADDYVTKPFSMSELLARVAAVLRRSERAAAADANEKTFIRIGELEIDVHKRALTVKGEDVELTATEFDLLCFLALHPGRAYSREQLLTDVWGYTYSGYENTVNVHINRLRTKIETDPRFPRYIVTVWGVGYRFAEPHEVQDDGKKRAAAGR